MENLKFDLARKGEVKAGDVLVYVETVMYGWVNTWMERYHLTKALTVSPAEVSVRTAGCSYRLHKLSGTYRRNEQPLHVLGNVDIDDVVRHNRAVTEMEYIIHRIAYCLDFDWSAYGRMSAEEIHDAYVKLESVVDQFMRRDA